jgi:hypothetical protein
MGNFLRWTRSNKEWRENGNPCRTAPVQIGYGEGFVPWEISAEAWKEYAAQGHGSQSHERICERGGWGASEMAILLFERIKRIEAQSSSRAPAAHGESATARVHYVEHRIREDVGFWVAEPREQSGAAAVYASRQMKGTTALVYALDIHDALTFATKTECEEWIRARELPLVACEHLVVSSLPPAPSAPTTREADVPPAGLRCLACEVRPATRYARDAEGFGFALCGACRLDDEVPAAPASERKP